MPPLCCGPDRPSLKGKAPPLFIPPSARPSLFRADPDARKLTISSRRKPISPRWRKILRKPCRTPIPSGVLLQITGVLDDALQWIPTG